MPGCRRSPADWSASSPTTSCAGWSGCPNWPSTTSNLPDILLLLATDIAAVDHHEGTITLIANAVNWNGTDERVDWAYDDAVARLDVMTEALGTNLSSTVATFSRPEPRSRKQRSVDEYGAIVEKLVGDIEAGEAFQVVPSQRFEMDTGRQPTRRVPDAARDQSEPVHVPAQRARRQMADWTFRSSGRVLKRW